MAANVGTAPVVAEATLGGLTLRILSALALAPIAVAAILLGWPYFELLVALGGGVLAWEWDRLCGGGRFGPSGWLLVAIVLASIASASLDLSWLALAVTALGALLVHGVADAKKLPNPVWQALGALYLGIPSIALLWLRTESGAFAVLWLFLAVWATDIGAYTVGRLAGGPRLAPRLSPNKTWAGLAGGVLAAAAVGALFARDFGVSRPGLLAGLGAAVALVAQAGDLTESAVKRHFKVKDTSALIPGHGGLFDRVDGLLAAAPALALVELLSGGSIPAWR